MKVEINGNIYNNYQARDASKYKRGLFPEGPSGHGTLDFLVRLSNLNERVTGKFYFSPAGETGQAPKYITLNNIAAKMGTQKHFFKGGASVLDIGAGAGIAVSQLSEEFPKVRFVGLDYGYVSKLEPAYKDKGNFVGADWNRLPFGDASFNRIMSLESFPKHANWIWDHAETFKEVTRVSAPGTVWRGTHAGASYGINVYEEDWVKEMLNQMNGNGWDVCVANSLFIAKLVNKKDFPTT